jgi:hypothetical protein
MSSLRGLPLRVVLGALLLVSLLVAGGVSLLASDEPDGLNRVAQDEGFAETESDHATGNGPLAGYETSGVEDPRISGGLAGVLGAGVVLVLTGGLTYAVRRRGTADHPVGDAPTDPATDPAPDPATDSGVR